MEIVIKPMESAEEIRGKAFVHWKSWQDSYKGVVDAGYLARLTLEKCEEIAFRFPESVLVAKDGETVVGFAAAGKYRGESGAEKDEGEVYALYVLEAYQRRQIGYALMRRALEMLSGCRAAYVWVLAENAKAIRFYERVGFRADGAEKELVLGAPIRVVLMAMEL